jgi:hypothetical protein
MNIAATSQHPFKKEIVHRCLTDRCQDCSGLYHSDALGLEILCYCTCHHHNLQKKEYKDNNRLAKRSHIAKTEQYLNRYGEAVTSSALMVSSDETSDTKYGTVKIAKPNWRSTIQHAKG